MHSDDSISISIWFFIGVSLAVNGVLVTAAGIYQYLHPPENPVVLNEYHAGIWWGAILLILGAVYCYYFTPRKKRA